MAEDTSQQSCAGPNTYLRIRCALGYFASALLLLTFCCVVAHAQMEPVSSATTPGVSTSGDTRTRARRVAEASDSTSATSPQEARQSSEVNSEDPPVADQTPKTDRVSALRAQIKDATNKDDRARLQRTLVDYLIALKRQGEAIKELRAMMREERIDPVGFYNIGNALARLGDTPTAIDAYRKAIDQRRGNYARALNNMGVLLIRQERWEEALQALSSALKQENFRYGEASYNLGRVYAARGETKLAINEWTRALAAQPDHLDAALLLARALAASGETERAIAVIDAFVARQGPNKVLADTRNQILAGAVARKPAPAARAKP